MPLYNRLLRALRGSPQFLSAFQDLLPRNDSVFKSFENGVRQFGADLILTGHRRSPFFGNGKRGRRRGGYPLIGKKTVNS